MYVKQTMPRTYGTYQGERGLKPETALLADTSSSDLTKVSQHYDQGEPLTTADFHLEYSDSV